MYPVSTRGSCDALLSALILLTLYAAAQHRPLQSGALLGCAVHFRVYPIIHALPLGLFFLLGQPGKGSARYRAGIVASATCGAACVAAFAVLGGICYAAYGWPFVEHAYLYHISRSDPRHNFSPWFLSAYLHATTAAPARTSFSATLTRVAPQAACVIASGSAFWRDPAAAFFFQTMLFVAFNRVITAQYFTWWMALAPLLAPGLLLVAGASRHVHATVAIAALWLIAQLLWLATAARLEFGDPGTDATVDAFAPVWVASVLFLAAQTILVTHLLRVYTAQDWTARRGTRLVAEISTLPGRAKTD
jgi:GPI mannosyltransferase 1 subunit M